MKKTISLSAILAFCVSTILSSCTGGGICGNKEVIGTINAAKPELYFSADKRTAKLLNVSKDGSIKLRILPEGSILRLSKGKPEQAGIKLQSSDYTTQSASIIMYN
jgi:hypothetical protein